MSFPYADTLFQQALTHASFCLENPEVQRDNEQLEFLGDAVLQLCMTDVLLELFPKENEGDLTRMRHLLVDTETLADVARRLGIGPHIRMGRGEENDGGRDRDRMLANVFEALLGALYQTQGLDVCRDLVRLNFTERAGQVRHFVPPKQQLMEWCQKTHQQTPVYKEISRTGPSHDLIFTMGVWICGELVAKGSGQKKKEATIATAINALERLGLTVPKPE
jgi:ribonuclease-3